MACRIAENKLFLRLCSAWDDRTVWSLASVYAGRPPPWRVDGLFVVSSLDADAIVPIDASGIPYVTINAPSGKNGASVMFDDAQGARLALEYLYELGHRNIAYADSSSPDDVSNHVSLSVRREAYCEFMRGAGLSPMLFSEPSTISDPAGALRRITGSGATAVLTYYHHSVVRLVYAAAEAGVNVPLDLSVVCFNDAYGLDFHVPSMTAVALPYNMAGKKAAEMMLGFIRGPAPAERHLLLHESLHTRGSTAPVRNSAVRG